MLKQDNMNEKKNIELFETNSNEFRKKADRVLSVIKNINRQGGITTQLMMAAACIEIEYFYWYLLEITHTGKEIDKNAFVKCSELVKYIRLFKDAEHDLFTTLLYDNSKQREDDEEIISYLKEEIYSYKDLSEYMDYDDYLDSWKGLQTDHGMLCKMLYHIIQYTILGLEDTYQIIREPIATANTTSKKKRKTRNNFREFIRDKERTEEIMGKFHRLIGNKTNTLAADIIKEAKWIEWIDMPTIPSIKEEFPNITCSATPISRKLNEALPTKNGKVDTDLLDKIREKFEQA